MRLAVVAPHPDDEAIACGGTIATWRGEKYCIFINYEPSKSRRKEAVAASEVLGSEAIFAEDTKEALNILGNIEPDLVLIPYELDHHPHHQKCSKDIKKGWKGDIWEYETWNVIHNPDMAVWFNESVMRKKQKAIRKHKSQCKRKDWPTAVKCFNRWRAVVMPSLLKGHGTSARQKAKYCEAFKVVR